MKIRNATQGDFEQIEAIHLKMGSDYQFPNLDHPLFVVRKVAEEDRVLAACFLRLSAECFLWLDTELTPRAKVDVMNALQPEVLRTAWALGLDDIEARIPDEVERRFQKRLRLLGWTPNRNGWHPWTVQTHA